MFSNYKSHQESKDIQMILTVGNSISKISKTCASLPYLHSAAFTMWSWCPRRPNKRCLRRWSATKAWSLSTFWFNITSTIFDASSFLTQMSAFQGLGTLVEMMWRVHLDPEMKCDYIILLTSYYIILHHITYYITGLHLLWELAS